MKVSFKAFHIGLPNVGAPGFDLEKRLDQKDIVFHNTVLCPFPPLLDQKSGGVSI